MHNCHSSVVTSHACVNACVSAYSLLHHFLLKSYVGFCACLYWPIVHGIPQWQPALTSYILPRLNVQHSHQQSAEGRVCGLDSSNLLVLHLVICLKLIALMIDGRRMLCDYR